jgi:hypothetical protein
MKTLTLTGLSEEARNSAINGAVATLTGVLYIQPPQFATSCDAVMPLLEQFEEVDCIRSGGNGWQVIIHTITTDKFLPNAAAATLPLAACIAILRAHGWEVVM